MQSFFIDFNGGVVDYDNLTHGISVYNEDLLQVSYTKGTYKLILDAGWYGNTETRTGFFKIMVVENSVWEYPLFEEVIVKENDLPSGLYKAVAFISGSLK